jgi:ABC-type phosphate/phosphonate transport system permease subunit
MRTKLHHSHSFFSQFFPPVPRDYLARRRWFRKLSTTLMVVVLSVLLAAFIVYTSNPSSFGSATR